MGTNLVISLGQLLSLIVLALVAGLAAWLWRRRQQTTVRPAFLDTLLEAGEPATVARLQEEVSGLRTQVNQLRQELETLKASRPAAPPQANYSQAIEMARQGQSAPEVANRCGISRAEAELIVAMHGGKDKT